jgi:hypothetical protein
MNILKKQEKNCMNCAYLSHLNMDVGAKDGIYFSGYDGNSFRPTLGQSLKFEFYKCRATDKNFTSEEKQALKTKLCEKYLRKKEGMTLEQQLNNKLSKRIERNWKVIVEVVGVIAGVIAIIELFLLLIHY